MSTDPKEHIPKRLIKQWALSNGRWNEVAAATFWNLGAEPHEREVKKDLVVLLVHHGPQKEQGQWKWLE